MPWFLVGVGRATYRFAKPILALGVVVVVIAVYGISQIQINDNPTKWFTKSHPIRVADRVLDEHFGGTYMAYLALLAEEETFDAQAVLADFARAAKDRGERLKPTVPAAPEVFAELAYIAGQEAHTAKSRLAFFVRVAAAVERIRHPEEPEPERAQEPAAGEEPGGVEGLDTDDGPGEVEGLDGGEARARQPTRPAGGLSAHQKKAWDEAALFVSEQAQAGEIFKDPAVLACQEQLQQALLETDVVGKSNSLADIVKTVHREFVSGEQKDYRLPANRDGVAQMLIQYESSHRKDDLWHFVTPDYRRSSIWVQLTSGDNKDMSKVVEAVERFLRDNPPPRGLVHKWFGLTYINVIWQEKMVTGMLGAFLGSFLVVFLMMTVLFRSALWGILSMIPLPVTIGLIYGAIGLIGKDYDMPVAVLSSLTLELAVDFAIHFLARSRVIYAQHKSWQAMVGPVFGEPARAITRNVIVIAVDSCRCWQRRWCRTKRSASSWQQSWRCRAWPRC